MLSLLFNGGGKCLHVIATMQPTYLHQTYLPTPFPIVRTTCLNQPFTDTSIDKWLSANEGDAKRPDVLVPGYLGLLDVPSDQVLCWVILVACEVRCYDPMWYAVFI